MECPIRRLCALGIEGGRALRGVALLALVVTSLMLTAVPSANAQVIVPDTNVGYIDTAVVTNQFRLRYDAGYGLHPPDRAEFFYAKCGCFRDPRLQAALGPLFDPDAPGPLGKGPDAPVETNLDYQDVSAYLELAPCDWLSGFVEVPVRILNPEVNDNTTGFADMNFGFKAALWYDDASYYTFQFRTYVPTGDADRGLGTHNVNLEPALLVYHQLDERWAFEGELRDWIPIGGTDFAGNVVRYGAGLSYDLSGPCTCGPGVFPVVEVVGWTVLDGKKLPAPGAPVDASGDTIVNAKFGVRADFYDRHQFYLGYGRSLTGEHWYEDIARLELRTRF